MRSLCKGLLVIMTVALVLIPSMVLAVDTRTGNYLSVAKGEVVDDDLFIAGQSVTLDGTINGDVFVAAKEVRVNGTINGNLVAAAESVAVNGNVTGSVVAAGERLIISGQIGRNFVGAGSRVTLDQTGSTGHSWVGAGDRLEVQGEVGRGAMLGGDDVLINGRVGQAIKVGAGSLRVGPEAVVGGPVEYWSRREAEIAAGASTGAFTRHEPYQGRFDLNIGPWYTSPMRIALKIGGFLLVGLVLLAILPGLRTRYPHVVLQKPWQAPLAGFLALIALPAAAVILIFTIVGLPLGLLTLALYPLVIYCSQIFISWAVGRWVADRVPALAAMGWPVLFVVGTLLTTVLIQLPIIGGLIAGAALFYGLGGLYYAVIHRSEIG